MGKTLSFGKGKGNIRHNNREYETPNVDHSRVKDNIIYKQEDIKEAYQKCFGKAIEDYNAKQSRNDRKKSLEGYMDEIKRNQANKNGEKLFYEQVVGIGDMHDSGIKTNPKEAEKCREVLDSYMKEWEQRNPNLYVFNATLHMDEQTPHLHIDYIPIGEGYKQGLQARNSLTRAFDNMGIESAKTKDDNATIKWQERERAHISELAKEKGIEIETIGIKRDDYTISDYKALVRDKRKILAKTKKISAPQKWHIPFTKSSIVKDTDIETMTKRQFIAKKTTRSMEQAQEQAEHLHQHYQSGIKELNEKSRELDKKNNELETDKAAVKNLMQEQYSLNMNHQRLQKECEELKRTLKEKDNTVSQMKEENEQLKAEVMKLEERRQGLCENLANVNQAFNMLKYDKDNGYKVELTDKQSRLFDAIENYTKLWLSREGKKNLAEDVEKNIGLSKGIQEQVKALEPKQRPFDRGR